MKSYCKQLVFTREHVEDAFFDWSTNAAGKKNLHRVEVEYGNAETMIDEITSELQSHSLKLAPIRRYDYTEPTNGKVRRIGIESIKNQVLDYVAVRALEPFLANRIGFYQVSSVKGKGQLFASKALSRWSKEGGYYAQLDIRQCYPSISHEVVLAIIKRHVKSRDVVYLVTTLLGMYEEGLEIGSYFSLKIAQLVLSEAYHFVETLPGIRRQIWYMDDIVLFSPNKRDLTRSVKLLIAYLATQLGLSVKPWKVCKISEDEPIDLAGFVVRANRTTLRSGIFLRARRAFARFDRDPSEKHSRQVCSYWGWMVHSNCHRFLVRNGHYSLFGRAKQVIRESDSDRKDAIGDTAGASGDRRAA